MWESSVPLGPVLPFPDPRVCFPEIQVEFLVNLDPLMDVAHLCWNHGMTHSRERQNGIPFYHRSSLLERVREIAEAVSLVAVVVSSSRFALEREH